MILRFKTRLSSKGRKQKRSKTGCKQNLWGVVFSGRVPKTVPTRQVMTTLSTIRWIILQERILKNSKIRSKHSFQKRSKQKHTD